MRPGGIKKLRSSDGGSDANGLCCSLRWIGEYNTGSLKCKAKIYQS